MAQQIAWTVTESRAGTRKLRPYRVWEGLEICISRYARSISQNRYNRTSTEKECLLMIKSIISWLNKKQEQRKMSAEEKWLAESVDLCDLERRQRQLTYGMTKGFMR